MRIAYYLHHSSLKAGGIFTYSIGILRLLIHAPVIDRIFIIHSEDQKEYLQQKFNNPKVSLIEIKRKSIINKLKFGLSYLLFELYSIYRGYSQSRILQFFAWLAVHLNPYKRIDRLQAAVLHVPMQFSPIYLIKTPVITTLHDVQELHFPENFTSHERLHRAINTKKSVEFASHVIVSFQHIKNDLLRHFEISDSKVSICPPPFNANWFGTENYRDKESLKANYDLPDSFILYPAATWVHKNHIRLIQSLSRLISDQIQISLVCTGHLTEHHAAIIHEVEKLGVSRFIRFLGIVPEEDLIGLYQCTQLVVIPTLYEAGSGPLYEAMRYSTPVICASTTSLPETIGDREFTFDPNNTEEMASVIHRGLTDQDFRKRNVLNSQRRMSELASVDYVTPFLGAYQEVVPG